MPYHTFRMAAGTVLCQAGNWSGERDKRQDEELTDNTNNVSKESSCSTNEAVSVTVKAAFPLM